MNQEISRGLATKELVEESSSDESTARDLKGVLGGTLEERLKADKTIIITLRYGERAEVVFGGFWNGKLISSAQNAISRAYRLQRHKNIRADANQPNNPKEE